MNNPSYKFLVAVLLYGFGAIVIIGLAAIAWGFWS
jgi:hypothetical protein